jgi:predicted nucleotidyltransferase
MKYGLSEQDFNIMNSVFLKNKKIELVKIFGSRAKGNYRYNSDIDLVIEGEISDIESQLILSELDELPLPYIFDIKVLNNINNADLIEHIKRVGKLIYIKK